MLCFLSNHIKYNVLNAQFFYTVHKRLICIYDTSPEALAHFFHELHQRPPQAVSIRVKEQKLVRVPTPHK